MAHYTREERMLREAEGVSDTEYQAANHTLVCFGIHAAKTHLRLALARAKAASNDQEHSAKERERIVAVIRDIGTRFETGSASQNNYRALADAIEDGRAFPALTSPAPTDAEVEARIREDERARLYQAACAPMPGADGTMIALAAAASTWLRLTQGVSVDADRHLSGKPGMIGGPTEPRRER